MLSGDNLTIVLFFIGIAINIALSAMNAAGWKHPVLIRSLFGLAAVILVIGMAWPVLKTISPTVTAVVNQIATNPVSWFVVLMFGLLATFLRSPIAGGPSDRVSKPATSRGCVKNIWIDANSPHAPLLFRGTASKTFDKITLFLDYSAYFTGFGAAGWSQRRRIKLASFEPFEKGIRYEAPIISRLANKDGKIVTLMWGNDPDKDIISSDKYRARLEFAASGEEQYFYFMLVPHYLPDGQRVVTTMNQDDFSFWQEWEKSNGS